MFQPVLVFAVLAALSAGAIAFFSSRGGLLYYGDATAHVNIARRIVDSRTPGWDQTGTVWLPLPHVLMLPWVRDDELWQSGLAGAIPSGFCFVLAGLFFFLAARRAFSNAAAAVAACLVPALNPNLLYLQSAPMTEAVFLASLAGVLYCTVRFRQEQSLGAAAAAGLFSLAGALTRYEAWFLIPFVSLFFLLAARRRRFAAAMIYGAVACLGPLYWLAHNWWYFGRALEFYDGPYSAKAIQGAVAYPGKGDWGKALLYFRSAAELCSGRPLMWLGALGALAALLRRVLWPLALLALVPAFYLLSMHAGATPIFVPQLWPHSYYNTRYGLVALPLLGFAAGALVTLVPGRLRMPGAALVVLIASAPWIAYPRAENWICWQESQVNSQARRAWTRQAAEFFRRQWRPGDGIFTSFGDLTGIFLEAGIPLRYTLHDGNEPHWMAAVSRPDLSLWEEWAVVQGGDRVQTAVLRAGRTGPRYDRVNMIAVKGAPVIEIYRRVRVENTVH